MHDHTTVSVDIDTTSLPDGYDAAIRQAIITATGKTLPDIDLHMLAITNVTVGAARRVATALLELMDAGSPPTHRFAFAVWEEPAHDQPSHLLRYTPDTGLHSEACDTGGQPITTAPDVPDVAPPSGDLADQQGTKISDGPLIVFDPIACRAWLDGGAAAEAAIDDGFRSENLTIAAGLEELLTLLNHDATQRAWRPAPLLHQVLIWRTADGDGIDGGGLITVDLDYPAGRIRLACHHQGFDDFTAHAATRGIDAAVEALGHVADLVNRTYTAFRAAAAVVRPAYPDAEDSTAIRG
jgi:hypothetical protein